MKTIVNAGSLYFIRGIFSITFSPVKPLKKSAGTLISYDRLLVKSVVVLL